jgi:hypothetical protein
VRPLVRDDARGQALLTILCGFHLRKSGHSFFGCRHRGEKLHFGTGRRLGMALCLEVATVTLVAQTGDVIGPPN